MPILFRDPPPPPQWRNSILFVFSFVAAILYFLVIVAAVFLLVRTLCFLKKRWHTEDTFVVNDKDTPGPSQRRRLLSIDTFRG